MCCFYFTSLFFDVQVIYEDSSKEGHVGSHRIAISRQLLRNFSSFCSSFESVSSSQSSNSDALGSPEGGSAIRSPSTGTAPPKDWIDRYRGKMGALSSVSDPESKMEFVIAAPADLDALGDAESEEEEAQEESIAAGATSEGASPSTPDSSSRHDGGPIEGVSQSRREEESNGNDTDSLAAWVTGTTTRVFQVEFDASPMGITLTRADNGRAHVSRITPGGRASGTSIRLGDNIIGINDMKLGNYDDFMRHLPEVKYPAIVTLLRITGSGIGKSTLSVDKDRNNSELTAREQSAPPRKEFDDSNDSDNDDVMLLDAYKQLYRDMHATKLEDSEDGRRPHSLGRIHEGDDESGSSLHPTGRKASHRNGPGVPSNGASDQTASRRVSRDLEEPFKLVRFEQA